MWFFYYIMLTREVRMAILHNIRVLSMSIVEVFYEVSVLQ